MFRPDFDWVKKWAKYTPERMMLRDHVSDIEWSYHDFNRRSEALAAHLKESYDLTKGDRIATLSKNCPEYVFLLFACIKSGLILVPLNFRLTAKELDILLQDAQPRLIFFEEEFRNRMSDISSLELIEHKRALSNISSFLKGNLPPANRGVFESISEDDIVMILYTAGTTGLPKGAIITHKMLFWNSINTSLRLDLNSQDHTQSFAPFFHTGGWNVLFTPFVHHGASHTLLNGFDPDLILKLMEQEKATLLFGVPTMLQMMADSPLFEEADLSSVRYAIVGGAPMPIPLINRWHQKGVYIRQGYGLTEVGPNCFSLHQDDAVRKKGSIGFPNFYIDAKVMDESGRECGCNETGELWLRSPVVTPGYWGKKKETSEAITDGWFHTGDMVTEDEEGYFYVIDRKKNMFISGGENVYPVEVEKALLENPAVKETAVIGVPHQKWGEVGKAFVVIAEGYQIKDSDLAVFCKGRLAKYKIPLYFEFIETIPKNEAGKINRMELIKLHSEQQSNKR